MMHTTTAYNGVGRVPGSAAVTPMSASVTGAPACVSAVPTVYPATSCSGTQQQGRLHLSQHHSERTQLSVHQPHRQPPYRIVDETGMCATQAQRRHPSSSIHRHQEVGLHFTQHVRSNARRIPLYTTTPTVLSATKGRLSALCAELEVQRHELESVQRVRQSYGSQLQEQASCTLKAECRAPLTSSEGRLPVYPDSAQHVTFNPPPFRSLTQENVATDAYQRYQLLRHGHTTLKEYHTAPQGQTTQKQGESQERYILQRPQQEDALRQQQHQSLLPLHESICGVHRGSIPTDWRKCTSVPRHSPRQQSSVVKRATQQPDTTVSPPDETSCCASRIPQQPKGSAMEHQRDRQPKGNEVFAFCDKGGSMRFYDATVTCAGGPDPAHCLTNEGAHNKLQPSECCTTPDLSNTNLRNETGAAAQTATGAARVVQLDIQKTSRTQDAVRCIHAQQTSRPNFLSVADKADSVAFAGSQRLQGTSHQHAVPCRHQLRLPQQQLYCSDSERIHANENETERLVPGRDVSRDSNALICSVACVDHKSETIADEMRCNSGTTRNSTCEKIADVEELRPSLIQSSAQAAETATSGNLIRITTYEAGISSSADDRPRSSHSLTITNSDALAIRQRPGCHDRTGDLAADGGATPTFGSRDTAVRECHTNIQGKFTDLFFHPSLTGALVVPSSVIPATCANASGGPPSLLAVHVAVVKPRNSNATCACTPTRCTDKKSLLPRREAEPYPVLYWSRSRGGDCIRSSETGAVLPHGEDSTNVVAKDSCSSAPRNASNSEFFSNGSCGASGDGNEKIVCDNESRWAGSDIDVAEQRAGLVRASSPKTVTNKNDQYNCNAIQTNSKCVSDDAGKMSTKQLPCDHASANVVCENRGNGATEEKSRKCYRRQKPYKQKRQAEMDLPLSKSVHSCTQSANQYSPPPPRLCAYPKEKMPPCFSRAASAGRPHLRSSALNSRLPFEGAVGSEFMHGCRGMKTRRPEDGCGAAHAATDHVFLDNSDKHAFLDHPDSVCSTDVLSSDTEKTAPCSSSVGATVAASTVKTPTVSFASSTQEALTDRNVPAYSNAPSGTRISGVSLTEKRPVDGEEIADAKHCYEQKEERSPCMHCTTKTATPPSTVPDSAFTFEQTSNPHQLVVHQAKKQTITEKWPAPATPFPESELNHVLCVSTPMQIDSSGNALVDLANSTSELSVVPTAAHSEAGPQNGASCITIKKAIGEPTWQKCKGDRQLFLAQSQSSPQVSGSSTYEAIGGSRASSVRLENETHQMDTQPARNRMQQPLADTTTLRWVWRQHVAEAKEELCERQLLHQNDLPWSQQAIKEQPYLHQQHSYQSPESFGLNVSWSKPKIEHYQSRVHSKMNRLGLSSSHFCPSWCRRSPDPPRSGPRRSKTFRRTRSTSWCKATQGISSCLVREQRPAAAVRRKSFPTWFPANPRGENETARALRVMREHHTDKGENNQYSQEKRGLMEEWDGVEHAQSHISLQRNTSHGFLENFWKDNSVSCSEGRETRRRRSVSSLAKNSFERQTDSSKIGALRRLDKRQGSTKNSMLCTQVNVAVQKCSASLSVQATGGQTALSPVAEYEGLASTLSSLRGTLNTCTREVQPAIGGTGCCTIRCGLNDDVSSGDRSGSYMLSGAADDRRRARGAAPGTEPIATESPEAVFGLEVAAEDCEAQQLPQSNSSTTKCNLLQGSASGTGTSGDQQQMAGAEAVKQKTNSSTAATSVELYLDSEAAKIFPGAAKDPSNTAEDTVNDVGICAAPKHTRATAAKKNTLPATPRRPNETYTSSSVPHPSVTIWSGTSRGREICSCTTSHTEHAPVAASKVADPTLATSGDATSSLAATSHSIGGKCAANSSSTPATNPQSSRSAAQSATSMSGGAKDNRHALAFALYTKLLTTGLLPIESVSPATAEWLHASLQGVYSSSSQPPAEAWKHVVTALASAARTAGEEGDSLKVNVRQSVRSASVVPTRPQKRKEESQRRTVTRLRAQRLRADEASESPSATSSAVVQHRRDSPQRQRVSALYVDGRSQQDLERRETLALLSRLQEKAKERLRSPPLVHPPLSSGSSTQPAALRSAGPGINKCNSIGPVRPTDDPCKLRSLETYIAAVRPSRLANVQPSSLFDGFKEETGEAREAPLFIRRLRQPLSPNAGDYRAPAAGSSYGLHASQTRAAGVGAGFVSTSKGSGHYATFGGTYGKRRLGSMGSKSKGQGDCMSAEVSPARRKAQSLVTDIATITVKREHRRYDRQTTLFLTHDGLLNECCPKSVIPLSWETSEEPAAANGAGRSGTCPSTTREVAQGVDRCEATTSLNLRQSRSVLTAAQLLHDSKRSQKHHIVPEQLYRRDRQQPSLCVELEQRILQKQQQHTSTEEPSQLPQEMQEKQAQSGTNTSETVHRSKTAHYGNRTEQGKRQQTEKGEQVKNLKRCSSEPSKIVTDESSLEEGGIQSRSSSFGSSCRLDILTSTGDNGRDMQAAEAQIRFARGLLTAPSADEADAVKELSTVGARVAAEVGSQAVESAALGLPGSARVKATVADAAGGAYSFPRGSRKCSPTIAHPLSESEQVPGSISLTAEQAKATAPIVATEEVDVQPSEDGVQRPVVAEKPRDRNTGDQVSSSKKALHINCEKERFRRYATATEQYCSACSESSRGRSSRAQIVTATAEGNLKSEARSPEIRERLLLSAPKPIFSGICPPALKDALLKRGWEENPDGLSSFFHLRWLPTAGALAQLKDLTRAEMYAATPGVQCSGSNNTNSSKHKGSSSLCDRAPTSSSGVSSATGGSCKNGKDSKAGNSTARTYGKTAVCPPVVSAAPFLSGFSLWMVTRKNVASSSAAVRTKEEDEPLLRCQITNFFPDSAALITRGLLLRHLQCQMPFFFDKVHLQITPRAYVLNLEEDIAALREDFTLTQAECILKLFLLTFCIQAGIQATPSTLSTSDRHDYKTFESVYTLASTCQALGFCNRPPVFVTFANDTSWPAHPSCTSTAKCRAETTATTVTRPVGTVAIHKTTASAENVEGYSATAFSAAPLEKKESSSTSTSPTATRVLTSAATSTPAPSGWVIRSTDLPSVSQEHVRLFPKSTEDSLCETLSCATPRLQTAPLWASEEDRYCSVGCGDKSSTSESATRMKTALKPVAETIVLNERHTTPGERQLQAPASRGQVHWQKKVGTARKRTPEGAANEAACNDSKEGENPEDRPACPGKQCLPRAASYRLRAEGTQRELTRKILLDGAQKENFTPAVHVQDNCGAHISRDDWLRKLFHQRGSDRIEEAMRRLDPRSVKAAIYVTARARAHQSRSVERFDCPLASAFELRHLEAAPLRLLSGLDMSEADSMVTNSLFEILRAPVPAAIQFLEETEENLSGQACEHQRNLAESRWWPQQSETSHRRSEKQPLWTLRREVTQQARQLYSSAAHGPALRKAEERNMGTDVGRIPEEKTRMCSLHHDTNLRVAGMEEPRKKEKMGGRSESLEGLNSSDSEEQSVWFSANVNATEIIETRRDNSVDVELLKGRGGGATGGNFEKEEEMEDNKLDAEAECFQKATSCGTQTAYLQRRSSFPTFIKIPALVQEAAGALAWLRSRQPSASQFFINGWTNKWILKSAEGRGRQFQCIHDRLADVEKTMRQKYGPQLLVQKFIETPLLLQGRPFSLRQWVLVTCWNPLTVWTYRKSVVRFTGGHEGSACNRSTCEDTTNCQSCRNSIQQTTSFTCRGREYASINSRDDCAHWSDSTEAEDSTCARWSADSRDSLEDIFGEDLWRTTLYPQIKRTIAEVCKCVQQEVVGRENSHELFSFDFTVDATLKPWLLDVGRCPEFGIVSSNHRLNRLISLCLEDVLKVVLDWTAAENDEERRRVDTGLFELILREAATSSAASIWDRRHLLLRGKRVA